MYVKFFRVRNTFSTKIFAGFAVFILCLKLLFRKCVTYVLYCSFIKNLLINRLLTRTFLFYSMEQYLELKEVKKQILRVL